MTVFVTAGVTRQPAKALLVRALAQPGAPFAELETGRESACGLAQNRITVVTKLDWPGLLALVAHRPPDTSALIRVVKSAVQANCHTRGRGRIP